MYTSKRSAWSEQAIMNNPSISQQNSNQLIKCVGIPSRLEGVSLCDESAVQTHFIIPFSLSCGGLPFPHRLREGRVFIFHMNALNVKSQSDKTLQCRISC